MGNSPVERVVERPVTRVSQPSSYPGYGAHQPIRPSAPVVASVQHVSVTSVPFHVRIQKALLLEREGNLAKLTFNIECKAPSEIRVFLFARPVGLDR